PRLALVIARARLPLIDLRLAALRGGGTVRGPDAMGVHRAARSTVGVAGVAGEETAGRRVASHTHARGAEGLRDRLERAGPVAHARLRGPARRAVREGRVIDRRRAIAPLGRASVLVVGRRVARIRDVNDVTVRVAARLLAILERR